MIGDLYEDRPASHATHHATGEGPLCECERIQRWSMLAYLPPLLLILVLMIVVGVAR